MRGLQRGREVWERADGRMADYLFGHLVSDSTALGADPVDRTDSPHRQGGDKTQRCDRHIMTAVRRKRAFHRRIRPKGDSADVLY